MVVGLVVFQVNRPFKDDIEIVTQCSECSSLQQEGRLQLQSGTCQPVLESENPVNQCGLIEAESDKKYDQGG